MVKLKQNLQRLRPGSVHLTRAIIIKFTLLAGTLVLAGLLLWVINNTKQGSKEAAADCAALSRSAETLLSKNDTRTAYDQLKGAADKCAAAKDDSVKDPSNIQAYLDLIQYNSDLAVAAFASGDTEQAKKYAEAGIKLNEARSAIQSSSIPQDKKPELNKSLSDLYDIRDGYYQFSPNSFIDSGDAPQ